ncbi:MAG: hypothetical protein E5X80_09460 [Mesorhizobium sp.]|uniref:glycine-rich domain-containing protein n=1 Tax=Mesorhizobium sp. TaxID=1871066 RepID=UPI000FE592EE|nr:hypothetical protein [Mesorhizobium sp.]RWM05017.1 MAG: hypothetical protein EOR71_25340 [Mesorhizobium sp.]TIO51263.1 MAG: hypothetical protein E5X78_17290 [Mesorhizobium sp.]TIO55888.1 MAG: hypothetical protein E5X79_33075 [Mesorhizobium sp.]TJV65813.1 MAG: hypothetical protein E5X80_09460 [Mesorhizobium sp.]
MTDEPQSIEVVPGIHLRLLPGRSRETIASIIENAEIFDMTKIRERYMRDHDLAADIAEMQERELKRYLAICAVFDEPIGMRGDVDQFWHTFILFTREYLAFCYQVAGEGNFIHHTPNVARGSPNSDLRDQPDEPSEPPLDYLTFWLAYSYLFQQPPNPAAWPQL